MPIVYEVENVRDGSTISTRRVTAIQNGKKIFHLTGSFDSFSGGFEHNVEMPKVPGPDGLLAEHEHARNFVDRIPESLRTRFLSEQPIEARHVTFIDPCDPDIAEPIRHIWLRASDELPSNPKLHQCLLAFVRCCRCHHHHLSLTLSLSLSLSYYIRLIRHTHNSVQITIFSQQLYYHTVQHSGLVISPQLRLIIPCGFIEKSS